MKLLRDNPRVSAWTGFWVPLILVLFFLFDK